MVSRIVSVAVITAIHQSERQRHVRGVKDAAEFETVKGDWLVTLDHLHTFIVGPDKPDLKEGSRVRVILEELK